MALKPGEIITKTVSKPHMGGVENMDRKIRDGSQVRVGICFELFTLSLPIAHLLLLDCPTHLSLRSLLVPRSDASCWIRERSTGWDSGQGGCPKTWAGSTVSHTYSTRLRSAAVSAWE